MLCIMTNKTISTHEQLKTTLEQYLLGLCDLTGELMRKAVNSAINKDTATLNKIREFVSQIYAGFLEFDLRNGELRKKSDAIKWNLQKIEDLILKFVQPN